MDSNDSVEKINPIEFFKTSPVYNLEKDQDTDYNFTINKFTNGGKYIKGNMLFYQLNGVQIYASLDDTIFVDKINKVLFVRRSISIEDSIAPTDPENRQYIILYREYGMDENTEVPLYWEGFIGRTNCYEGLKAQINNIDIDKTIILVDNVSLDEALSAREFIKYLQNANVVDPEEIDLGEFYSGEE